jgi:lipopolysaccharide export LptBFGC system permease protein LptF
MSINILSEDSYKTGANVIFLKNNITNESQEYSLSNNGEIKLENNIKINMLDKKDDFNGLGKAIQISYNFPKSKRNYEQWLYKDYKEFNLITSSDDPFTLIYNNDEFKKIYNAKITFIPPYQKQIFYATILLSLLFLTLPFFRKKNEN